MLCCEPLLTVQATRQVRQQLGCGLWQQMGAAVRGVTAADGQWVRPGAVGCVELWQELSAVVVEM